MTERLKTYQASHSHSRFTWSALLSLWLQKKEILTRCRQLLSRTIELLITMVVKNHVIAIGEYGTGNNVFINGVNPVKAMNSVKMRIARKRFPTRPEVPKKIDSKCRDLQLYILEEAMDHHHTSKRLVCRVRWYRCTAEKDAWKLASDTPRNFISQYYMKAIKIFETLEVQPL